VIAPLITGSLAVVGVAALGYVIVGALLWAWHLADRRRHEHLDVVPV
jgi:DHA1 family bicyclomycin/chloramphenicol resistance-like MFS transporter